MVFFVPFFYHCAKEVCFIIISACMLPLLIFYIILFCEGECIFGNTKLNYFLYIFFKEECFVINSTIIIYSSRTH